MNNKIKLALLFSLSVLMLWGLCTAVSAEEKVAEGSLTDNIMFSLYNTAKEGDPQYTLRIEGTGSFIGVDTEGKRLSYKTRKNSMLAEYSESITAAYISEGIVKIEAYALAFMPKLREVFIPDSLDQIGGAAFQDSTSLKRIALQSAPNTDGFNLKNITSIGSWAFSGCVSVEKITFSEKLSGSFGDETFRNCRSLREMTVPEGIRSIGSKCFRGCTALKYVYFLGDPTVDATAFNETYGTYVMGKKDGILYNSIADSDIRYGGESPAEHPFAPEEDELDWGIAGQDLYWYIKKNRDYTENSPKYDFIIRGNGDTVSFVTKWGSPLAYNTYNQSEFAKYSEEIAAVRIEAHILNIGDGSFIGLKQLREVEIPVTLKVLGVAAFEHCNGLSSIYISGNEPKEGVFDLSGITEAHNYCFDGCAKMSEVIFSDKYEYDTIGTETFKNCTNLKSITVPHSVKKIEKNAFLDCERLEEVIFELDAEIHRDAFKNCKALKSFRGFTDSAAESFAKNAGINFLYPCRVAIRRVGTKELMENIEVVAGQPLERMEFCGAVCLLYDDPEGKVPHDMSASISETTTVYADPIYIIRDALLAAEGEYLGMRCLFSAAELEGNSIYSISELGAIASLDRGTSGAYLTREMDFTDSTVFFDKEGASVKGVPYLEGGRSYSFCAVGFEDGGGSLLAKRCDTRLYFRGYAVIEDRKSGESYTFYTDMISATLRGTADGAYIANETIDDAVERISALPAPEALIKTKEELKELAISANEGSSMSLLAGSPATESKSFFGEFLESEYNKNGDVPALIRFDVNSYSDAGYGSEENIRALSRDIAEYARAGGNILLHLRPDNPLNGETTGGRLNPKDWENTMTPGTPQYKTLMRELGITGMLIQFLKKEGVNVYVVLLPEIASEYRWWCAPTERGGDTEDVKRYYKELWNLCAAYLEEDCSLDNIIFVYEGGNEADEYFPGKTYCHVFGSLFESSSGKVTLYG